MSWLTRSIVNSFKLVDDDDDDNDRNHGHVQNEILKQQQDPQQSPSTSSSPLLPPTSSEPQIGRGVKEDLSELSKTLTRQFWGVASFLAPPVDSPKSNQSDSRSDKDTAEDVGVSGLRSDFAEIGGRFKTGISKLSGNIGVSEISKIASSFLQFGSDYEAVGVTEEVIAFAKNIALHPQTWLDFPLPNDEDDDDFDMSDTQQEHALAVERLAPELTAIRIEICPEYMSEDHFWKIYFVLLHPRLNKDDAELLSTPQIVKARSMLMHESPSQVNAHPEAKFSAGDAALSNESATSSHEVHLSAPTPSSTQPEFRPLNTSEDQSTGTVELARPDQNTEVKIIAEPIVEEESSNQAKYRESVSLEEKYEDDGDDWLKEESSEMGGRIETTIPIGNDDDVSFSDLEDEDDDDDASHNKK